MNLRASSKVSKTKNGIPTRHFKRQNKNEFSHQANTKVSSLLPRLAVINLELGQKFYCNFIQKMNYKLGAWIAS
jgi:hypothetical protein